MTPLPPLLTAEEVADLCRVTSETVRTWARGKQLKGIKLPGGDWRFTSDEVEEFIASGAAAAVAS